MHFYTFNVIFEYIPFIVVCMFKIIFLSNFFIFIFINFLLKFFNQFFFIDPDFFWF